MAETLLISNASISLATLRQFLTQPMQVALSEESEKVIRANRAFLEKKIAEPDARYYGINTGFGKLCDVQIANNQLEQLQENLIMSHACGMGDEVLPQVVRLMMLLKVKALALGYSGVTIQLVQKLIELLNKEVYPVVYEVGSLGASGDLAPLSHLSLPLIGKGWVRYKGEKRNTEDVFRELKISPLRLKAKEGLALINGTQFMSAWGCWNVLEAQRVLNLADLCTAVSVDAFNAQRAPFLPEIQRVRPHSGQAQSAKNVLSFLEGSEIAAQPKFNVQDPYSFRCVPQVHGAVSTAIDHVAQVMETEINSVTDNPLIFEAEDEIVSGGNFHGEPLALALDYLGMAMSELASISERRTFQLTSGLRGLPPFLVQDSGLNSGLMIPQYTAASIVSMNKQLATPASVDSITSSAGQEDHVSMGANAAVKCYKIVYNIEKVLSIEFMTAMQGLEFRAPLKSSPIIEVLKAKYRQLVSVLSNDRILYPDMQVTVDFLREVTE